MTSKQRRLLQFIETMTAAASAYHSLHYTTKWQVDLKLPDLGRYLSEVSEGLAEGTCEALEAEGRQRQARGKLL